MGLAFKNFILALALPTFINTQCLPPATTAQPTSPTDPTEPTDPTDPTPTTPKYFAGTAACPPNQCWDGGCETDPNNCQIVCGEACETACPDVQTLEPADMNADKCSELCIESRDKPDNDKPCRFWRYDRESGGQGVEKKTCTFLGSDQCQFHSDCSGYCECQDVGCPGENGQTEAPKKACLAPIVYYPGSAWIHWACFNIYHPDLGNPYNPDTVMHADTQCHTTTKCADWDEEEERMLKVRCDGNGDGENGRWVPDQEVGSQVNYDGVLLSNGNGVIAEHKCNGGADPATLVVTILDMGIGGELSCEIPDADQEDLTFTITAPNKCVLLCDYHLAMVIEGSLNDEGEFKFYVTNVDPEVEIEQANVSEKIKCW